ncbi:MAG: hypothetical protein Q4G69_10125 [Planctomycetia bacterium]|nr:hypothetical protein [Planctomycetia bacterium]
MRTVKILSFVIFLLMFTPMIQAKDPVLIPKDQSQKILDLLRDSMKAAASAYYSPNLHSWYSNQLKNLPSAKQVIDLNPNPVGYGTGMDDNPLYGGVLLVALVELYELTGDKNIEKEAYDVYTGLKLCATAHGIPGYIARGICVEDGKSAYITSSRDQYTHFVDGLWQYYHSQLCDEKTQKEIRQLFSDLADAMKKEIVPENYYGYLRANGTPDPRGLHKMWNVYAHEAARLPMIFAAAWDTTGKQEYFDLWRKYLLPSIEESFTLKSKPKSETNAWVPPYSYFQMQCSLALLYRVEKDPAMKKKIREAIQIAADMVNLKLDWVKNKSPRDAAELLMAQQTIPELTLNDTGKELLQKFLSENYLKWKNPPTIIHLLGLYIKCCQSGLIELPTRFPAADWIPKERPDFSAKAADSSTIVPFHGDHDPNMIYFLTDLHVGSDPKGNANLADFHTICDQILLLKPYPKNIILMGDLAFENGSKKDYELLKNDLKRLTDKGIALYAGLGSSDNKENFSAVFPNLIIEKMKKIEADYADFIFADSEKDLADIPKKYHHGKRFFIVSHKPLENPEILAQLAGMENCLGTIHGQKHNFNTDLKSTPRRFGLMSVSRDPDGSTRHGFTYLKMDRWEFIFRPVSYNQNDVWERGIRVIRFPGSWK